MTHEELNNAMGIELSEARYIELDSMYLKSGLEHDEFIRKIAEISAITREAMNESYAKWLIEMSVEYMDENLSRMAIETIGIEKFLEYKVRNNLHLFRKDREKLLEMVGKDRLIEIINTTVA